MQPSGDIGIITAIAEESNPIAARKEQTIRSHLLAGWLGILIVVLSGMVLEGFHAFKVPLYLDVESETRRLLWRLAHAHLGLLSVLSLVFAQGIKLAPRTIVGSRGLLVAQVLVPAGFLFGGVGAVEGDPSLGIALLPVGAVGLLVGVGRICWALLRTPPDEPEA